MKKPGFCDPFKVSSDGSYTAEATHAANSFKRTLQISASEDRLSISSAVAGPFVAQAIGMEPPPVTYVYQCSPAQNIINTTVGDWNLTGNFGFTAKVTFTPRPPETAPVPVSSPHPVYEDQTMYWAYIAGATLIIAGAIAWASTPLTGPGGPTVGELSFATAAALFAGVSEPPSGPEL